MFKWCSILLISNICTYEARFIFELVRLLFTKFYKSIDEMSKKLVCFEGIFAKVLCVIMARDQGNFFLKSFSVTKTSRTFKLYCTLSSTRTSYAKILMRNMRNTFSKIFIRNFFLYF